ncbi:unnamed protein product [Caenorhabditis bovis]|uniref:Tetraspanin n=1 Tax=Caenorhabditis bovis TaxID=2654633 RepID=A0A8S1FC66_9PELO|nr:unnamed protein product [Caenorhabditis bovis]
MKLFGCFEKKFKVTPHQKLKCFHVINLIFFTSGAGALAVGIWLYISRNDFIELTPMSYSALSSAGLSTFTGTTICIISIVGFSAVVLNRTALLYAYIAFVMFLTFIHSVTRGTSFFSRAESRENLRGELLNKINRTYVITKMGRKLKLQVTWDHLQRTMKCCGVDTYEDWFYTTQWPNNEFVPESCCNATMFESQAAMKNCGKLPDQTDNLYQNGCFEPFADWLFHHITVFNWLTSILLVIEVITVISGITVLILMRKERKNSERRRQQRMQAYEANEQLQLNPFDRIGDASIDPDIVMPDDAISIDSR